MISFVCLSIVVNQYYEAEVLSEYVIRGNAAVLKCNIPSFVADFVRVEAWLGDDGSVYNLTRNEFGIYFHMETLLNELPPQIESFIFCFYLNTFVYHSLLQS